MADTLRLVGETKLRSETRALRNRVSLVVDGDRSEATADAPESLVTNGAIVSDSPDVARFLRRWHVRMEATARYVEMRARPALTDPKPRDLEPVVSLPENMPVACPACNGEGWYMCQLCDGEACVTRRRADEWRTAH